MRSRTVVRDPSHYHCDGPRSSSLESWRKLNDNILSDFTFSFDILVNMSETDLQLLTRYSSQRAEDAFAEIVRRHIDLVHSAALRQVRSHEFAEEVAQAVFVELARQARHLPPRTVLAAWLYQVARRRAIDVVRREAGRRLREQTAQELQAMNATAEDWTHIEPLLDDAMDALEETDRLAVLLRYFQNKPLREVGQAIGVTDDAAQKRVSRAVERLQEFFAKRGVTVGASGLVIAISANAVQSAPAGLALAISTAGAVAGTTIAAMALAAAKTVTMTTLQKTFITATLAAAALIGIYEASRASVFRNKVDALQQEQTALTEQINRERDEATRQLAALRDENARLQRDAAELVRLRGQVTRLRQDLVAASKRGAPVAQPVVTEPAGPAPEPVRLFEANAQTTVPAGQTLAFGGWTTAPGKRTLVFVKPKVLELTGAGRVGSIMLEARFIEFPEEVMLKAASDLNLPALAKLKTDNTQSSTHCLFSPEEAALILQTLESNAHTLVVGAPRIQTGDGQSAILGGTEQKLINGQEYSLGPSLEVVPSIDADGSSVKLNVTARLNAINPDQQAAKTVP